MKKFYKVIKENFLWEVGGIVGSDSDGDFKPETDIMLKHEEEADEYLSKSIVENSPDYFQRVYKVDDNFHSKEDAKSLLNKSFKP